MVLSAPADLDSATPFAASVRSLLRPILIGLALTLLLVLVRGGIATYVQRQVALVIAVEHDLSRAHEAMLDQQTGIRGWLLTGEDRFLEPYRAGGEQLRTSNDELLDRIVRLDDVEIAGAVKDVWDAQQRWLLEWAVPVLGRSGPVDDALLAGEKERFDQYRREFGEANGIAHARVFELQGFDRRLLLGGISLQALTLLLCTALALRQHRRLQHAVVQPVEGLLVAVNRIEAGEYRTALPVDGPRELRALAEGIAQMAVTLQRADEERTARETSRTEQVALATQVLDLSHEFTARLDVAHVLDSLVTGFGELSGAPVVTVWLISGPELALARSSAVDLKRLSWHLGEGMVGRAGVHGTAFLETGVTCRRAEAGVLVADALALPMVGGGRTQAVLEVRAAAGETIELGGRLSAYRTLAAQGGLALAAAQLHQKTVELGRTDALTGVSNRRTFDEDVNGEVALSQRVDRPLCVVLLDIDHFKLVNDTYGHPVGDDVLREVGRLLRDALRESDTVYRYGGEEFVVLLRDTPADQGVEAAERLRLCVERGTSHRSPSVTVSGGVGVLGRGCTTPAALLEAADVALYAAKAAGRNRVEVAPLAAPPPTGAWPMDSLPASS